jgi:hypothetical protein
MSGIGKYIYGVINSGQEQFFALDQIVPPDSICPAKSLRTTGTDPPISCGAKHFAPCSNAGFKVYSISFQDISAVVSDAETTDYSRMPKDILVRHLLRHQQVIEKIMAEHTIIPMKFGTFAGSNQEIMEILAKGYRTIKDVFERAKNTIEIDVAATWNDLDSLLREISEEMDIKQLKQSLLKKQEAVTIDDQMKVGILVKQHLDKNRAKYADQIQSTLGELAQSFKAHDLMDDKMVLNTAFLIEQNRQSDFEQKVDELNREFKNRLNFRCVGPLPPYSFFTLEVKKTRYEEVDWARKKLGLTHDFVTANDIKKAHRRVALACHPDKNPQAAGIEKKFDDMTKAYKILLDYYRASNPTGQTNGCHFGEESFEKDALLVTTMD